MDTKDWWLISKKVTVKSSSFQIFSQEDLELDFFKSGSRFLSAWSAGYLLKSKILQDFVGSKFSCAERFCILFIGCLSVLPICLHVVFCYSGSQKILEFMCRMFKSLEAHLIIQVHY